jgi:hypothetical protein
MHQIRWICVICIFQFYCMLGAQTLDTYLKPYDLEVYKELSLTSDGPVRYENIGEADDIGPVGFTRLENGNYEYFDPITKVGRLFDNRLNYLRRLDYGIETERKYEYFSKISYTNKRIIIGEGREDMPMLFVYEEGKSLIGYYQFEEDTEFAYIDNARIYVMGDYAFYFKAPGEVEWLERPLTKKEIDSKKYAILKKSTKNIHSTIQFKIGNDVFELSPEGILYQNGKLYEKIFENMFNYYKQWNIGDRGFGENLKYLGKQNNGIIWQYHSAIVLTDQKFNVVGFFQIDRDKFYQVKIGKDMLTYWGQSIYVPDEGLLVLAREMLFTKINLETTSQYVKTDLCKIIPQWDVPTPLK